MAQKGTTDGVVKRAVKGSATAYRRPLVDPPLQSPFHSHQRSLNPCQIHPFPAVAGGARKNPPEAGNMPKWLRTTWPPEGPAKEGPVAVAVPGRVLAPGDLQGIVVRLGIRARLAGFQTPDLTLWAWCVRRSVSPHAVGVRFPPPQCIQHILQGTRLCCLYDI